eukprot:CAMPEP_0174909618 /NCGR_PEP_ID=MMETSP0167-20121228/69368_1 /TAXON_ID=38298 /ORGANISM="Rhodella maculata, Strain CCMP736" /LENGTH=45 /DNA_ID= /DNA_START= /DNA_END= /DNA_ORIENTATION=
MFNSHSPRLVDAPSPAPAPLAAVESPSALASKRPRAKSALPHWFQ